MKIKHVFAILLILSSIPIVTSCTSRKPILTEALEYSDHIIKGNFKILKVDKLGNTFLVSNNNEVIKVKNDKVLFRYSSKRLGNITHVDVTNPQKILVYFGDYYQIVFLDNTLSEIDRLDLEEMGFWDVQSVALSRDNFIWIYDPVNVKLVKISSNGKVILSSNELFNIGYDAEHKPSILIADEQVYLYDTEEIKIFDEYGGYVKTIPLTNDGIQYLQQGILFLKDGDLKLYTTKVQFKEQSETIMKVGDISNFQMAHNVLHITDMEGYFIKDLAK